MADQPWWEKLGGMVGSALKSPTTYQNLLGLAVGGLGGREAALDYMAPIEAQRQHKALQQLWQNLYPNQPLPPGVGPAELAKIWEKRHEPQKPLQTQEGSYQWNYETQSYEPIKVEGKPLGGKGGRGPQSETALRIYAAEHPDDLTAQQALSALDIQNERKRKQAIEDAGAKAGAGAKARLQAELGGTLPPIVPGAIPETGTGPAPNGPPTRNITALQGVAPNVQQVVRALVDYRIPLPSGFALRSPYWQQVLSLASQYDPTFDATQYQIRMSTRRDFTSGQSARAINSLNTVVGHLDTLQKRAKDLAPSWSPAFNSLSNLVKTQAGSPIVKNFTTARDAVANELTRVFRNTGGTESDIRGWKENISAAGSPEQLQGAINQAIDLLDSRLDALRSQYEKGMGRPLDFTILNPRSQEIIDRLRASGSTPSGEVTAPSESTVTHRYNPATGEVEPVQ